MSLYHTSPSTLLLRHGHSRPGLFISLLNACVRSQSSVGFCVTPEFVLNLYLQAFIQAFQPHKYQRQAAVCLSTHLGFVGISLFIFLASITISVLSSIIWVPEVVIGILSSRQTL